jgi:hypothetical protein
MERLVSELVDFDESWCSSKERTGMVVLDITGEEGVSGTRRRLSFARVSASVGSIRTAGTGAAADVQRAAPVGYFTIFMLEVEPAALGERGAANCRVSSWEEVFGEAEDVNYVYPMPCEGDNGRPYDVCGSASQSFYGSHHLAVAAGSVGEVDIRSCRMRMNGLRTVVCVVYCLEGPSTVTLHVHAGTHVVARSVGDCAVRVATSIGRGAASAALLCAGLLGKAEQLYRAVRGDELQKCHGKEGSEQAS